MADTTTHELSATEVEMWVIYQCLKAAGAAGVGRSELALKLCTTKDHVRWLLDLMVSKRWIRCARMMHAPKKPTVYWCHPTHWTARS